MEFQGSKDNFFTVYLSREIHKMFSKFSLFQLAKKQPLYIGGIFPISGVKYVAPELAPGTAVQYRQQQEHGTAVQNRQQLSLPSTVHAERVLFQSRYRQCQ
jgi:hypothetical protein